MSGHRLADLRQIAGVLLEARLAVLRESSARHEATRARIGALDAAVARQHAAIAAELEAPVAGPVLDRWGSWAERRRSALNQALAAESQILETQRKGALFAFGRDEALRIVAERADAEARRAVRRRKTRGQD